MFCRSFSNFQYFDSKGMFISFVYSIPLLLNTVIIVVSVVIGQHPTHIMWNIKSATQHLFSHEPLSCTLTGSVAVQDLFHYDWAQDTSSKAKSTHTEEREERLIPLPMSKKGLHLEELGIVVSANPEFWRKKANSFSLDCKKIVNHSQDWVAVSGNNCLLNIWCTKTKGHLLFYTWCSFKVCWNA